VSQLSPALNWPFPYPPWSRRFVRGDPARPTLCPLYYLSIMSGSSYRLETPRARPPPLLVDKSSYNSSSSILGAQHNSEPLLYNLPTAHSMSPPASPRSRANSPRSPRSRLTSPTSPTFGRSRTPINGRPAPSPSSRNRSATPSGVAASELDQFAEYCRAW
jgi:hypothetical protein